ncbi:MAG: DUF2628 domain-containing protein [Alsobacter sp.]
MTLYTVHSPELAGSRDAQLMQVVLVKDGVHWLALVFPILWLLFHRIWWGLLGYVAAVIVLALLGQAMGVPQAAIAVLDALIGLALAVFAHDLQSWQLGRRGYAPVDVVTGRDQDEAERRYFDRVFAGEASVAPIGPTARPPAPRPQPHPQVLGLFPEAEGAR